MQGTRVVGSRISSHAARACAGVAFAAILVGTAACSGAEDPSSKDQSAAYTGDTFKDPTESSKAPAPAGTTEPPTLGGDYRQLLGAWESKGVHGPIAHAVFYDEAAKPLGHAFFADLRPAAGPSPTVAKLRRATGSFTVTRDFISLDSDVAEVTGAYRYNFNDPNTVIVSEPAGPVTYVRVATYCDFADDCEGQVYPHLDCVGSPTCVAHVCGWTCGEPTK